MMGSVFKMMTFAFTNDGFYISDDLATGPPPRELEEAWAAVRFSPDLFVVFV